MDSVSNHQPHDCLLNCLFRRRWKKTSKFRVTGLCVGNSPGTGEFPAQMACNAENVYIWWRHHVVAPLSDSMHPLVLWFSLPFCMASSDGNKHKWNHDIFDNTYIIHAYHFTFNIQMLEHKNNSHLHMYSMNFCLCAFLSDDIYISHSYLRLVRIQTCKKTSDREHMQRTVQPSVNYVEGSLFWQLSV